MKNLPDGAGCHGLAHGRKAQIKAQRVADHELNARLLGLGNHRGSVGGVNCHWFFYQYMFARGKGC